MDRKQTGELEGQTSINELLDAPVGNTPIQTDTIGVLV